MKKHNIFSKAVSMLIATSVVLSCVGITPVFAAASKYYISEDFADYATNSTPANITVDASKTEVLENEEKTDKYLVLRGVDQLISATYTLQANMDNLFISFDMERTLNNETNEISIKSNRGNFVIATVSEKGELRTYNGKYVGYVSDTRFTNIAFSFIPKHSRYTIYVNGKAVASDYYVKSNFPSGQISALTVNGLIKGEGSFRLDNVYCYDADSLLDAKAHPKKEFNTELYKPIEIEVVEDEDTSIMKMSSFNNELTIKDDLGTAFQTYGYDNIIDKVYDNRNDNHYVKMLRNTSSSCFVDLYTSAIQKISYQFDLRSPTLSKVAFLGSDRASNKMTLMTLTNDGTMVSNGVTIGKIQKRQWTNVTICADNTKKVASFYINGELAAEKVPFTSNILEDFSTLRVEVQESTDKELHIDNYVVYKGAQYKNYSAMLKGIIDENLVIYNLKTNAVNSVLEKFNAVSLDSGAIAVNGEKEVLEKMPKLTDDGDVLIGKAAALKLVGADAAGASDEEVSLKQIAAENNKVITVTDIDLVFVGDDVADIKRDNLIAVNSYLIYERPEKEIFAELITDEHPRIFINKEKLAEIKANFGVNEYITEWGNDVIKTADSKMSFPALKFAEGQILNETREMTTRIMDNAMSYLLTEDEKYFDKAWEMTEALCNFTDWDQDGHALDSSMAILGAAICYDWLYDKLTDEQKALIVQKSHEFQLEPAYKTYHQALPANHGWATVDNNWNTQCNGWIIAACCAMFEENPEMYSDIIENALRCLENVINKFYPSGAWHEGPGYWNGTVQPFTDCLQTLVNTFGTDFGLSLAPDVDITTDFSLSLRGPAGVNNYNDGSPISMPTYPALFYFSNRYGNPGYTEARLYDMERYQREGQVRDLCYYDTSITSKKVSLPLDSAFSKIEIASLISSWTDPTGTFVSFHSGNNLEGAYHAHVDSGTFVMDMLGERFAYEMGSQDYNSPGTDDIYYQSQEGVVSRWSYYNLSAEGHNTLVINPDHTSGQNIVSDDKIETLVSKPKGAFAITSLSSAYEGYAKGVRRGIMLGDERRTVTIRDEIELNEGDNEVWWFMHVSEATEFELLDDKTFTLEVNGKKIKGTVLTNSATKPEIKLMEAVQLIREVPAQQTDVTGNYNKVGIKLTGTGNMYINVKFVPVDDYFASQPVQNIPLDNWSIPDGELIELPVASAMTFGGKAYEDFTPVNISYELMVPYGTEVPPDIALSADSGIVTELVQKAKDVEDVTKIKVYNQNNPNDYRMYYFTFKVDMSSLNDYKIKPQSVEVSDVPQPENPAEGAIDGNMSTRWSSDGEDKWLILDFGQSQQIEYIGLAFMSGNVRKAIYKLYISDDKQNWELLFDGMSSGTTADIELSQRIGKNARYVKFVGYGNTANAWNSITEIAAYKLK